MLILISLLCCFTSVICEKKPVISVEYARNQDTYQWIKETSGSSDSYTKYGDDYIISGNVAGILFKCSAAYPVYWKINLDWKIARFYMYDVYFYTEREIPENDFNDTSKYKYSSNLVLNYFYKEITGNYTCIATNGDKNKQKSVYIYFDEFVDPPYLMHAGKTFEVEANKNEIAVLPCNVYDPDIVVYLFRENITEAKDYNVSNWIYLPLNDSISYNPKIGFQMKVKELPNIEGYYRCTTNETQDFVHINVRREIRKENEETSLDERKLSGKAKYFWNKNTTQFYCCSNSDKPPEMRLAYCLNAITCKTNRDIITALINNKTLEISFPYYHSSYVEANDSCSVGQLWSDMSSVIICKGDGISLRTELHTIPIFHSNLTNTIAKVKVDNNFNRKTFDVVTQWEIAPLTKYIYIEYLPRIIPKKSRNETSQWKTVKKIYSGDKLIVRCHALDYFFARGTVWAIQMKNGTLNIMRNVTTGMEKYYSSTSEDFYPSRVSSYKTWRTVVTSEMDSIVCLGPIWNSSEWISAHFKLNVLESTVPTIEGKELEMLYWTLNDTDMTLNCKATGGIPTPTFTWTKDGKKITNSTEKKTYMITNGKNVSTLHVHFVSHQIHGEFRCSAGNVAGWSNKTFSIFIREPHSVALIGGVSALLISFLIRLTFLFVYRMKKRTDTLKDLRTETHNGH